MSRRPIIAGNWKMNLTGKQGAALVAELAPLVAGRTDVDVLVCPSYVAVADALGAAAGTGIAVGAQDCFWKEKGAYTSQVSPQMLVAAGVTHVIIGHSETRGRFGVPEPDFTPEVVAHFGESDVTVNRKLKAAAAAGLVPIVCCGETFDERNAGTTDAVVSGQIRAALVDVPAEVVSAMVLAYEPVWAIGTGATCETPEANRVCGVIRATVAGLYGAEVAEAVRIQYGGSVKAANAVEILSQEHIDGALVGGAALEAEGFSKIVAGAPK